jgi:hypothetical protein
MDYYYSSYEFLLEGLTGTRMNHTVILTASIAAGILTYLVSRNMARLTNRMVITFAVAALVAYSVFLFLKPGNWIVINLVVLVVAGLGGSGLGLLLKTKPSLLVFCIVASVVDIYSVTQGATSALIGEFQAGTSQLLRYLAISGPVDGSIRPLVGIGDYFIISAIYFTLIRLGYKHPLLVLAPLLGLLLAIIIGLQVGGIFAIPFIAATTIAYLYWQERVPA